MDAKDVIAAVTPILGLTGLTFGLYQYYVAQKWKRSEFAAKQLEQLRTEPELSLLCKLLDWRKRQLPVPAQYLSLANTPLFEHNWTIFAEAMIEGRRESNYTWQQAMYRDLVDRLCEYLQGLNHYVSVGLINPGDIATVAYWLQQLASPRFALEGDEGMFLEFIEFFEYSGVTELMHRFDVNQPPEVPLRLDA